MLIVLKSLIKAANSSEACVYCDVNLRAPPVINANHAITAQIDDAPAEPILKFLDFRHISVDLLHLLLRLSDFLFELCLNKLSGMDGNNSSNLARRPNLSIFLEFLEHKCKITNAWYVSKEDRVQLRNLTGNESVVASFIYKADNSMVVFTLYICSSLSFLCLFNYNIYSC